MSNVIDAETQYHCDKGELFNEWSELEREINDFKEGATNEKIEKKIKIKIKK